MTAHFSLADALATAAVANRNPAWGEYKAAAPCEQRAIIARWWEIYQAPTKTEAEFVEWNLAAGRWQRAFKENQKSRPAFPQNEMSDHEEYQGEAADRGVDGRGFNVGGQS